MRTTNPQGLTTPAGIGIVVAVIAVVAVGAAAYQYTMRDNDAMMENKNMVDDALGNDSMMKDESRTDTTTDAMNKDAMTNGNSIKDETMMKKDDGAMMDDDTSMKKSGSYTTYSAEAFNAAKDQKRVLFFYASWCPTCRPVDAALQARTSELPAGVTVFRVNYDTEKDLKAKYGVTYEHTFVQVDANGNAVTKWNGGGVDDIVKNVQ